MGGTVLFGIPRGWPGLPPAGLCLGRTGSGIVVIPTVSILACVLVVIKYSVMGTKIAVEIANVST